MLDDLIKSMFLGGFFSEDGADGDEAESFLEKALAKHKDPSQIFAEAKVVGLEGQISMLQGALADFAKERELLAKEVKRLRGENSDLKDRNARLSKRGEHLREQLRQRDGEVAHLQARISDLYSRMEAIDNNESTDKVDEASVSAGAEAGGNEEVSDGESADETDENPGADGDDKTENSNPAGVKEEWVGY